MGSSRHSSSPRAWIAAALFSCLAFAVQAGGTHRAEGLGTLPWLHVSWGQDVNADGSVVVGSSADGEELRPVVWLRRDPPEAGWMPVDLGSLSLGGNGEALGVSADGLTVVGWSRGVDESRHAFRWTAASGLEDLRAEATAEAVSADGSVVVGWREAGGEGDRLLMAWRWTAATGVQDLGSAAGYDGSVALDVSDDGSVIVGRAYRDATAPVQIAFRWTESGGFEDLGRLQAGRSALARGVSGDGLVVVGSAWTDAGQRAFRWEVSTGMVELESLGARSEATAADADGSVIVGWDDRDESLEAVRWDAEGRADAMGHLACGGHGDFAFTQAFGLSADGRVAAGSGTSKYGIEALRFRELRPCAANAGDVAPGLLDESTDPPTWRAEGDGRIDVADTIVLLRAAVGLQVVDCEP